MAILIVWRYLKGIIVAIVTRMVGIANSSPAPEKNLFLEHGKATRCSSGENSRICANTDTASTARYSETNHHIRAANSYNRRIRLLMSSGLIKGIIPTSVRMRSRQLTLDSVFLKQDGDE